MNGTVSCLMDSSVMLISERRFRTKGKVAPRFPLFSLLVWGSLGMIVYGEEKVKCVNMKKVCSTQS